MNYENSELGIELEYWKRHVQRNVPETEDGSIMSVGDSMRILENVGKLL